MCEQINSWSLSAKNRDWKMEFQAEDAVDSKNSSDRCGGDSSDNDVAMSPTLFLHSWESERKLIDILITLSEEAYEEEKPMDQLILCGGWDDAVHGWRTDNFHSSNSTWKKTKKSRKEKNDSQCVVCAEMVPIIESRTGQDIEQSKSSSATLVHNFIGENFNSSSERSPPAISQTKIHADSSTIAQAQENEACKEIHNDDKTKTEINPHREKEYEIILSTSQKVPVRKHFTGGLLPPVKMASGGEMSASGVKPGTNFSFDTQNSNLKIVSEAVENSNNSATKSCLRTHHCNMAMLQVSETGKTAISTPIGITRIMNHWCWRYFLMQDNHNLAISSAPASKLMEYHNVGVQPSKIIRHHKTNIKQDSTRKSAFHHSCSTDKGASRRQQKVTGQQNILPVLP